MCTQRTGDRFVLEHMTGMSGNSIAVKSPNFDENSAGEADETPVKGRRSWLARTFDHRKLDFDGYATNWPLVFRVSSLNCLGAGGKEGKDARWSPVYFGIRVSFFLFMLVILVMQILNEGIVSQRYICTDPGDDNIEICAARLSIALQEVCPKARAVQSGVTWTPWECACGPTFLAYLTHVILIVQVIYLFFAVYTTWRGRKYVQVPVPENVPKNPMFAAVTWFMYSLQVPAPGPPAPFPVSTFVALGLRLPHFLSTVPSADAYGKECHVCHL